MSVSIYEIKHIISMSIKNIPGAPLDKNNTKIYIFLNSTPSLNIFSSFSNSSINFEIQRLKPHSSHFIISFNSGICIY